ncbi:MAG: hypothetical protein ACYTHJ_11490 [Planctomycetota bacterium]|jgi:hypothetical protein
MRNITFVAIAVATQVATTSADQKAENLQQARQQRLEFYDQPDPPTGAQPKTSAGMVVERNGYVSVQVNVDGNGNNIVGDAANEPSIAIDPNDSNKMCIGWRQFDTIADSFRQAGNAYSTDGGETWASPGIIEPGVFRSDPVLAADADGKFYYNSLRVEPNNDFFCDVFISADGGQTWDSGTFAFGGDKQWMAIDRTGGQGLGHIYASWNSVFSCCGGDFTHSTDDGATYLGPENLPSSPFWGTLDVGPDGDLYISGNGFVVLRSNNAQNDNETPTFGVVNVDLGGSLVVSDGPNPQGLLGQAWVATDHSDGPSRGNVYLLSSVDPPGSDPLDVMFARSEDGGTNWTPAIKVNVEGLFEAYQWFGTMAVAPNGRIDVIFNDTKNSFQENISELFYTFSIDQGDTWQEAIPVSPAFDSHLGWPQQNKIGDYYDMISDNTGTSIAYAATFNGEQDVYFLRIDGDCNENNLFDRQEIADGSLADEDGNGIPDICEAEAIPTASNWGVAIMALLVLLTGTIVHRRGVVIRR